MTPISSHRQVDYESFDSEHRIQKTITKTA